jgi:hypothetical protein
MARRVVFDGPLPAVLSSLHVLGELVALAQAELGAEVDEFLGLVAGLVSARVSVPAYNRAVLVDDRVCC